MGQQYSPELQSESTTQTALQLSLASISVKPHLGESSRISSPTLEENVVVVVNDVVVTVAPVLMVVADVVVIILVGLTVGNVEGDLVGEAVPSIGSFMGLRVGENIGPWVIGVDGDGESFQQLPLWQQSPQ